MSDDKLKRIEALFSEGKAQEALALLEAFLEEFPFWKNSRKTSGP